MIFISINTYAQGNLSVTLVPKTYVGNYHLSCNGASNGEIEAIISGGTSPYSVLWNTNSTANPIINLPAGAYSVTIIDAANDTVQANYTLVQPPALSFNLEVPLFGEYNLQYYGSTFGSIKINGTGGTPSYSVVWSDNNTELIIDSLAAGTYSFVLSDANGCTTNGNKTLTQPAVLAGSVSQIHGTSCFEGDDGKAEVTVTGGIPPYRYLWDNGSFSAAPEDLTAGVHEVHVSDDKNNTLTLQVTITQAAAIDAQITKSNYPNNLNVSCYNCFNGTLDAIVTGGTAPYTYEWIWQDNSIGTTANLTNLGGGDYELIVNDQNNCRFRTNENLKEPERQDWGMSGNAGTNPATQFIGTTDSVDVVFKSNSAEQLRLSNNFTKICSGNLMIGDSLGVFGSTDSSGNNILKFGLRDDDNIQNNHFICGQNYLPAGTTQNIFGGFIYAVAQANRPQLALGADGNNAIIETSAAVPKNTSSQSESRLLLNYYCGRDVFVGNSQAGNLIANQRLGINNGGVFDANENFKLHVEGKTHLNGSVRIGNETNDETNLKLAVEGQILARQIKVIPPANAIWPDYVFEKDYPLLSFSDLRKFFLIEKHLPEIASEAEMKEIGHYNLAIMDASILKKLEESYLYILQLEARIAALEKTATKN
jgi:hypothetical protein